MIEGLRYIAACAARQILAVGRTCPSCGHEGTEAIARKHLVTELRRCGRCALLFRVPTLPVETTQTFYQQRYSQGFTTELPDAATLEHLLATGFRGTEKDYRAYIAVLDALQVPRGARVFDFGCSWGYGSWQLRQHGFNVEAFELSQPRAEYGRRALGLSIATERPTPSAQYDVFFTAHVLEHVPSVADAIAYGLSMLKPGGLLVAMTPNASAARRRRGPDAWQKAWGLVHPNFLDDRYYQTSWSGAPMALASAPYDLAGLSRWIEAGTSTVIDDLSGEELLFVRTVTTPQHQSPPAHAP